MKQALWKLSGIGNLYSFHFPPNVNSVHVLNEININSFYHDNYAPHIHWMTGDGSKGTVEFSLIIWENEYNFNIFNTKCNVETDADFKHEISEFDMRCKDLRGFDKIQLVRYGEEDTYQGTVQLISF